MDSFSFEDSPSTSAPIRSASRHSLLNNFPSARRPPRPSGDQPKAKQKLENQLSPAKRSLSEPQADKRAAFPSSAARFSSPSPASPAKRPRAPAMAEIPEKKIATPMRSSSAQPQVPAQNLLHGEDRERWDELVYLIDGCRARESLEVRRLSALKLCQTINKNAGPLMFLMRTVGGFHVLGESFNGGLDDFLLGLAYSGLMLTASREKANAAHMGIAALKNLIAMASAPISVNRQENLQEAEDDEEMPGDPPPHRSSKRSRKKASVKADDFLQFFISEPQFSPVAHALSPILLAVAAVLNFAEDPRFRVFLLHAQALQLFSDILTKDFRAIAEIENQEALSRAQRNALTAPFEFRMSAWLSILELLTQGNGPTQLLVLGTKLSENAFAQPSTPATSSGFSPFSPSKLPPPSSNSPLFVDFLFSVLAFYGKIQRNFALRENNKNSSGEFPSLESALPGSLTTTLAIFRLFVNLTNKNTRGAAVLLKIPAQIQGISHGNSRVPRTAMQIILEIIEFCWSHHQRISSVSSENSPPSSDLFDVLTLGLAIFINGAELSEEIRSEMMENSQISRFHPKAGENSSCSASQLLVELFASSYGIIREYANNAEKDNKPMESGDARKPTRAEEREESRALCHRICCSYSALLVAQLACHSEAALEEFSSLFKRFSSSSLSLTSVCLAMREFLILQSEASLLTQETLASIVEIIEKLEKFIKEKQQQQYIK